LSWRTRDRDQDGQVVARTYPSAPAQGVDGCSAGAAPGAQPLRHAAARTACPRSPGHHARWHHAQPRHRRQRSL